MARQVLPTDDTPPSADPPALRDLVVSSRLGLACMCGYLLATLTRSNLANDLIVLGIVVVVPIGLELLDAPGIDLLRRAWPVGAAAGAIALALPTGRFAAAIAGSYVAVTVGAGLCALALLLRRRSVAPDRVAAVAALGYLPVSGLALIADRLHATPLGYSHEIVKLTVAHFLFAGFAASLLSGLTARQIRNRASSLACYGAIIAPALVGATFSAGPRVQLLGVVPLTVSLVTLAVLTLSRVDLVPPERGARWFLRASSLSVVAPMLLALDWTLGLASGVPHLSLEQMEATHGVLNAVGYALCGVIAWRLGSRRRL